jgi:hypothetical protein
MKAHYFKPALPDLPKSQYITHKPDRMHIIFDLSEIAAISDLLKHTEVMPEGSRFAGSVIGVFSGFDVWIRGTTEPMTIQAHISNSFGREPPSMNWFDHEYTSLRSAWLRKDEA